MTPILTIDAPLTRGSSGPLVRLAQEWLNLALGEPAPANLWVYPPVIAIDGQYGDGTVAAVRRFQRGAGLLDSGDIDPATWAALTVEIRLALAPLTGAVDINDAMVQLARRYLSLDVREVGGNNLGPWVRLFCGSDGAWMSWCAGFVSQLARQASAAVGVLPPFTGAIACDVLGHSARLAGKLATGTGTRPAIKPGSLVLFRAKPGNSEHKEWHHVELVETLSDAGFTSVGGNTNDTGSPDGYGIFRHSRKFGGVDFISI